MFDVGCNSTLYACVMLWCSMSDGGRVDGIYNQIGFCMWPLLAIVPNYCRRDGALAELLGDSIAQPPTRIEAKTVVTRHSQACWALRLQGGGGLHAI